MSNQELAAAGRSIGPADEPEEIGERHNGHCIIKWSRVRIGNGFSQMVEGECFYCRATLFKKSEDAEKAIQWNTQMQKYFLPQPCSGKPESKND